MEAKHFSLRMWGRLTVATLLLAFLAQPLQAAQAAIPPNPLVVVPDGAGNKSCRNWANACTLQQALSIAQPGNFIWVAEGTHVPGDLRTSSFKLKNGVTIYGGFDGTETFPGDRDWTKHETILSGDIGLDDNSSNNAYHVVVGSGTNSTAVLDGFTIQNGNANGSGTNGTGAGMYNLNGSPTLTNLIFTGNSAVSSGAGMYNSGGSPALSNATFSSNVAASSTPGSHSFGGGMSNNNSSPSLTNVTFSSNKAGVDFSSDGSGGGMFNTGGSSSPSLNNVTFSSNSAVNGGGIYLGGAGNNPQLTNVRFNQNSAQQNGGGIYNNGAAPVLSKVTFSSNKASVNGGGMFDINSGNAKLTEVLFSANTATSNGGGMYNETSAPIMGSVTFTANKAGLRGGGIYNINSSAPVLSSVTFNGNTAKAAAGMYNFHSSNPKLSNVTFTANTATDNGGGIFNDDASDPTLTNVTFSGNHAASGAGMFNAASSPTINDSIFWADGTEEIGNSSSSPTIADSIVQGGCPVTGTPVCTNVLNANPKLGVLRNNGAFAQSMWLGPGSAAIDKGNNLTCAAADQRGVTRPQGPRCDLGAYEVRFMSFRSTAAYDGFVWETSAG